MVFLVIQLEILSRLPTLNFPVKACDGVVQFKSIFMPWKTFTLSIYVQK